MSVELKIKSKHLSEEARIIRKEEIKYKRQAKWLRENGKEDFSVHKTFMSLKDHRKWDVRNEQRATFLARAFIAGTPYKSVESNVYDVYLRDSVLRRTLKMVQKYHDKKVEFTDLQKWVNA